MKKFLEKINLCQCEILYKQRKKVLCLGELVLIGVAIYLFFIAYNHSRETKDALILGAVCIFAVIYLEVWRRLKDIWHTILSIVLMMGLSIFILCELCIAIGSEDNISNNLGNIDYILVLGSKLEGDELSDTLKARLDRAVQLSAVSKAPIIVSGGNDVANAPSEASVMEDYLVSQGVGNDILVESKALDTRQNFLYTAELADTESKLVVITSEIHLFRAKMLARNVGFQHIYGMAAQTDSEMLLYYNLREVVSILREIIINTIGL